MSEFSHPNFGDKVEVRQKGREVSLVFIAHTYAQAGNLAQSILEQLKSGALKLTIKGEPSFIVENK